MKNLLVASSLAALLLLAGCAEPASPADDPVTPTATSSATTTSAASLAPEQSGIEDERVEGEFRLNFNMTGCLNPRILFFLDPDDAQALLPTGFVAADAADLLKFTGAPFGSPVPTGRAVGGYDFLSCASDSLAGGPAAFSQVGILVQPPNLGERTPVGEATYDLYLLALHVDGPAWTGLAARLGFADTEAPLSTIASAANDHGGGNHLGSGSVTVGSPVASADYQLPSAGRVLDLQARYWHASANGTSYLDFHLREDVRAGTVSMCSHAAGSAHAAVSGTQSCGGESRFAAVGLDSNVAGTAYWLPGVFPVPA